MMTKSTQDDRRSVRGWCRLMRLACDQIAKEGGDPSRILGDHFERIQRCMDDLDLGLAALEVVEILRRSKDLDPSVSDALRKFDDIAGALAGD